MVVNTLKDSITLYCIASVHGSCTYHWRYLEDPSRKYPSSPVVYVNKGGFYQCTVEHNSQHITGNLIRVVIDVGKHLQYYRIMGIFHGRSNFTNILWNQD